METKQKVDRENQFEKIEIPKGILMFLEKRAGIQNHEFEKTYSVSKILTCLRKSYYGELNYEKEIISRDAELEQLWSTTRGDLLHEITRAYRWRELDTKFKVYLENGKIISISGRLDMYDWKTKTIIDLKTTKFVNWQISKKLIPRAEHIRQIQCYGTMFSGIIPVERLCLVYADMDGLVAFRVQNKDMTKWMTMRVQELEEAIEKQIPPKGQVSSLCQFCSYQGRCFDDGNGITYEPTSIPKSRTMFKSTEID